MRLLTTINVAVGSKISKSSLSSSKRCLQGHSCVKRFNTDVVDGLGGCCDDNDMTIGTSTASRAASAECSILRRVGISAHFSNAFTQ